MRGRGESRELLSATKEILQTERPTPTLEHRMDRSREGREGGGGGGQRSKGGGIVGRKMQTTDAREEFLARKDFRPESFRSFELSSFPLILCEEREGRGGEGFPATARDEISSELRYHEGARKRDFKRPASSSSSSSVSFSRSRTRVCVPHTCKRNGHVQRG